MRLHPKPVWYLEAEQRGHRRALSGLSPHGDMLVANLTPACDYWPSRSDEPSYRCLFCGYGAVSERSRNLAQERGVPTVASETLQEFRDALPTSRVETKPLYMVGGFLCHRDAEGERYFPIANAAIAAEPGYWGCIGCGSQALPRDWCRRLHEAGVGYACVNLEVWGDKRWSTLCQGKARFIGYDDWIQSLLDAVDVFGSGSVFSAFVAGAELTPPWGLGSCTPAQALDRNLEGTDWLLRHGIMPIHSPFSPISLGQQGPLLDYFLRLHWETARRRRQHRRLVTTRFVCSGCT